MSGENLERRPSIDVAGHGGDESLARARRVKCWKDDRDVVVVELEHGAAVGVGRIDPLAAKKRHNATAKLPCHTSKDSFHTVFLRDYGCDELLVSFRPASRHVEGAQQEQQIS